MKNLHRSLAAGTVALMFACAAQATPFSTDVTDLWYNPDESGWGLSLYQQQGTVFAVLFVYGPDNQPSWYVASSMTYPGDFTGNLVFSGPLYRTSGPYFGGPFNPAAVGVRQVGQANFTLASLTTGSFSYSVDGVAVTKNVTRQTWANNNMTGRYIGGQSGTYSSCPGSAVDGTRDEAGTVTVSHGSATATLAIATAGFTCTYAGAYGQAGHYGFLSGSYSCSNGRTGNFSAFGLDAQISSLAGRIDTVGSDGCRYSGRIGGIRAS